MNVYKPLPSPLLATLLLSPDTVPRSLRQSAAARPPMERELEANHLTIIAVDHGVRCAHPSLPTGMCVTSIAQRSVDRRATLRSCLTRSFGVTCRWLTRPARSFNRREL